MINAEKEVYMMIYFTYENEKHVVGCALCMRPCAVNQHSSMIAFTIIFTMTAISPKFFSLLHAMINVPFLRARSELIWFCVCVDSLHAGQQFICHIGLFSCIPGSNQY